MFIKSNDSDDFNLDFSVYLQILSQDDSCRWIGCQNNGACVKINEEYECECGVQWIGKFCETKNSEYNQRYLSLACVEALHFRIDCGLAKVLSKLDGAGSYIREIQSYIYGKRQTSDSIGEFLKIDKKIKDKTIVKLRILG